MSTEITPKEAKIIENFLVQCIHLVELLELGDVVPQRIVHCVGITIQSNTIQSNTSQRCNQTRGSRASNDNHTTHGKFEFLY